MTDIRDPGIASDVGLDLSTLKGESAGSDTRYAVRLRGPVDERWVESCRGLLADSPTLRRFELDPAQRTLRFSCRTVDGTALVFEMLERIEGLVERVNELAAIRRSVGPRVSFSSATLRAR
jgi:hypothetical protein